VRARQTWRARYPLRGRRPPTTPTISATLARHRRPPPTTVDQRCRSSLRPRRQPLRPPPYTPAGSPSLCSADMDAWGPKLAPPLPAAPRPPRVLAPRPPPYSLSAAPSLLALGCRACSLPGRRACSLSAAARSLLASLAPAEVGAAPAIRPAAASADGRRPRRRSRPGSGLPCTTELLSPPMVS
jgi:hypothetical protein